MAQRKSTGRKPNSRPKGRASAKSNARRRRSRPARTRSLALLSKLGRPRAEFREDAEGTALLKRLYVTRQQRLRLLRWGLYIAVCLFGLIFQDVIMSRVKLFGATTDLAPTAILLITVMEGSETGSIFALLMAIIYFFSGTAPGAFCVGLISVLGAVAALLRQEYLHRSSGSIVICAAIAAMAYEMGLFIAGVSLGLTRWDHMMRFVICGVYCGLTMVPLYRLVRRIGLIGGNVWKE